MDKEKKKKMKVRFTEQRKRVSHYGTKAVAQLFFKKSSQFCLYSPDSHIATPQCTICREYDILCPWTLDSSEEKLTN